MSVFDTLADRRYEEWVQKTSASDYQPPAPVKYTAVRKSYEGHVFSEVVRHLDKAASASTADKRRELLETAWQLEIQLMLLLEKRRMPLAAATLTSSLDARRVRITGK